MMRFATRQQAGELLAEKLGKFGKDAIVLGIPRGGVIVAAPVAKRIGAELDVVVLRKIPIPTDPEAGFGAVMPDGTVVINSELVMQLGLSRSEIAKLASVVMDEIERRMKVYRGSRPMPKLENKAVIIVDDGLATGYTMLAAIKWARKQKPKRIVVAVPVSSSDAYEEVKRLADEVVCLHVSNEMAFAVASFYDEFPELSDREVIECLNSAIK